MFDEIFGKKSKPSETKPVPDMAIAFVIWSEKQPFYGKIHQGDETIKIRASDIRRLAQAAYEAGFNRGRL